MEINILLLVMIFFAILAAQLQDLLSSVIAVCAVGLSLSLAFLLLKAPDLAATQLVVEILSLIILVRATIKKDLPFSTSGRWIFNTVSTLASLAVFLCFAYFALRQLPPFGAPLMRVSGEYLTNGLDKTGATNLVSAISLDYRGYDTLGEGVVLFTAVIGVLVVIRKIGRIKDE